MAIVSYCGGLRQSGARWSPYIEIHFESVDPTEMRSEFGLLGCILNIDSPENYLADCSVRFIYIQHRAALGWIFGDGRAVGSHGLRVVCNRLYFQGGNREFDKTICWCDRRRNWKWLQPLTTTVVRRWWESLTLPLHNIGLCRLSWWVCCLLWSICNE